MRNGSRLAIALVALLPLAGPALAGPKPLPEAKFEIVLRPSKPTLIRSDLALFADGSDRLGLLGFVGSRRLPLRRPGATETIPEFRSGTDGLVVIPTTAANRPVTIQFVAAGDERGDGPPAPDLTSMAGVKVERFLRNDDLVFGPVAAAKQEIYDRAGPHFFLAQISQGGSTPIATDLPTDGLADDARVTIRISLAPTHDGLVQLAAAWGEKSFRPVAAVATTGLSTVSFACDGRDVPRKGQPLVLTDATTSIPPTTPDDTSDDRGAIWIDSVEIRAPMDAKAGVVRAEVEPDVWERVDVVELVGIMKPHAAAPDPIVAAKGADEVILTTTATAAGAARLAAHRTATGVRAVSVPFADVVDRLGYGTCDPEIVGRYLSQLAADGTKPRFLLLAGDAMRDVVDDPATSIPTAYVRTMYNGATPSDHALVRSGLDKGVKPPSVGRLPFRDAATMDAYVDRVIAYETKPPADATRRLLRFVTSEGRFGPIIDTLLQNLFENVVTEEIPPAYDVEVTFASANSAYCWPPSRFHEKVIGGLNEGALFYTYVGHGWAEGFDSLRVGNARYPILRSRDVPQVNVTGTPPAMFVVACTTATFDDPDQTGVGELLLGRPHGPLAYWGATRVCHPAWNSFIGRQIAMTIFKDPNRRIGEVLDAAVAAVLTPDPEDKGRKVIEMGARTLTPGSVPLERILEEGSWMYALLGDPAVRIALPKDDLAVSVFAAKAADGADRSVTVRAQGPFADGTRVEVSIEVPRNVRIGRELEKGLSPDDAMRARHASSNDKALLRATAVATGGRAETTFEIPAKWAARALLAKVWCVAGEDVHQSAVSIPAAK